MWGQGEEQGDDVRHFVGIVIFFFGVACCVIFFVLFTYKKIKQKKKEKKEFEELMRMQNEFAINSGFDSEEA